MRISRGFLIRLAVSLLLLGALFLTAGRVFAQHGCEGGNLIPNCGFDGPFEARGNPDWKTPPAWTPYVLGGSVSFREATDTYWGPPSLEMIADGSTFDAGVYTQVSNLKPGTAYKASSGWFAPAAPADSFCRKLGIDPTGGTNPAAPSVVWGPTHCGPGRMVNYRPPDTPNIDVSAVAQNSTVTVFAHVQHTYSTGVNLIFLDAVELIVDPNQPAAPPPTPTAPPPPPTAVVVPTQALPTATRVPTKTPTRVPTRTPTSTPTQTPVPSPTPTATNTPTPSPTDTPTVTPTSTLPPRPAATPTPSGMAARVDGPGTGAPQGLLFGGLGALGGALIFAIALVVVRRR